MNIETLSIDETKTCLESLIYVLNQRTHTRVVMGKNIVVGGSLAKALKLPELLKQIQSVQALKKQAAVERFQEIWPTLSLPTRTQALKKCGWDEPDDEST